MCLGCELLCQIDLIAIPSFDVFLYLLKGLFVFGFSPACLADRCELEWMA